jgi:acetyl-CoA carboxylase carboxyltransferase component
VTEPAAERPEPRLRALAKQARAGGAERYHAKSREQGKLFVRERLARLLDDADDFVEDGLLATPWPAICRPTGWSPAPAPSAGARWR